MCADGVTSNPSPCLLDEGKSGGEDRRDAKSPGLADKCLPETDGLLEDTLVSLARSRTATGESWLPAGETLTLRETQILQFIITGKTNKEIARMLCRSQRTVEYHRNRLMQKLHVRSVAELVRLAVMAGITRTIR